MSNREVIVVRDLDIPLQNGGVATFPVPMTTADHALLTTILHGLTSIHVRDHANKPQVKPAPAATDEEAAEAGMERMGFQRRVEPDAGSKRGEA